MERDDIIEYSLDSHHSEEEGVKIRKKIYFVTILLTVITAVEVALGIVWHEVGIPVPYFVVQWAFIIMTAVKAGYIIGVFMHLGDERKGIQMTILIPYILFIMYFIFIALSEANHWYDMRVLYNWLF
ncbi:MAG: cytochrome C oxidase subunit IV family protein [Flavobacteriales bacterium]|nr:cytochrome C oxidase subunit IV family protein [Flavobacteriales bacterium]